MKITKLILITTLFTSIISYGQDVNVGESTTDQSTRTATYGSKLNFLGANNNSDLLWMARYNVTASPNASELRMSIGDDAAHHGDKFVVGVTNSTGWIPRFTVNGLGNVGIGTTNPSASLHLYKDRFTLYGPNTNWGQYLKVGGDGRRTTHASVVTTNGNLHLDSKDGNYSTYINHYSKGNTYLNTQGGNVGIGTTSPKSLLSIVKAGGGTVTDGLENSLLYLDSGNSSDGSVTIKSHAVLENSAIGALKFHSSPDAVNYSQAAIKAIAGKYSAASTLAFYTSSNNTQRVPNEVMRIQDKNVGIGTTNPTEKLDLRGDMYINSGVNDNHLYWAGHNMTMGTRVGSYSHNVFHLKPGGANQGKLFSQIRMYNANSPSDHELKILLHSNGNSYFNAGNVGIGTTSPSEKLEVNGNIKLKNNFIISEGGSSISFGKTGRAIANENTDITFDIKGQGEIEVVRDNANLFSIGNVITLDRDNTRNVGIGTTNPTAKLHVGGDIRSEVGYALTGIGALSKTGTNDMNLWSVNNMNFGTSGATPKMTILKNGNVGIGTTNNHPDYKLSVNGKIQAKEIKVHTGWSDFVFYDDYKLPTLQEVENHIAEKGHLQDIPSAETVEKNGIFLGEMDSKLLQKIEELTLYTIQQEKKIAKQEAKSKKQDQKIELLIKRLEKLEASK